MNELIRRQDAYNVLTDYYHHRTDFQHTALKDALYKVPPAIQWIPCNESLPDIEGNYLVTFKLGCITTIEVCYFGVNGWDLLGYDEVLAWMPLPKHYENKKAH